MSQALDQLRAAGFTIGPGKLHRLRVFGIRSTRCGREYRISEAALTDLRYILSIERFMQLVRDHNGLCLELAYRNYHTIPWDRVHRGARDRVAAVLATLDRELHRAQVFLPLQRPWRPTRRVPVRGEALQESSMLEMKQRKYTDHDFDGHEHYDDRFEKLIPAAAGLVAEEAVHLANAGKLSIDLTLPVRET